MWYFSKLYTRIFTNISPRPSRAAYLSTLNISHVGTRETRNEEANFRVVPSSFV